MRIAGQRPLLLPGHDRLARALLILGALLCTLSFVPEARSHSGATLGFATVTVEPGGKVDYSLALSATAIPPELAERMDLAQGAAAADRTLLLGIVRERVRLSAGDSPCTVVSSAVPPPKPGREDLLVEMRWECPTDAGPLVLRDALSDAFGQDYHTLAHVAVAGHSQQYSFGKDEQTFTIESGAEGEGAAAHGAGSFFPLGIEHILTGYDHLLFLIALILCGGSLVQLLKIVTAFTLAHSVTLALAALDVITLPGALVESVIALSIAYVAAENLLPKFAISRRWTVSFLFGLVHGFGFSSVLREIGLPKENLVLALLNFNLGVEAGQAAVVLLVLPLLLALRRKAYERRVVILLSSLILIVGLVLSVERLMAFFE